MKKLILASVSVLALSAGAAFAQSNSSIDQEGSNSVARIDQIGGSGSNTSSVYQIGAEWGAVNVSATTGGANAYTQTIYTGVQVNQSALSGAINSAAVNQYSNTGGVLINQGTAGGAGTNSANVNQSGNGNITNIDQSVAVTGSTNTSNVNQGVYGTSNIAYTQQTGASGVTSTSNITQNSSATGGYNLAYVHQH